MSRWVDKLSEKTKEIETVDSEAYTLEEEDIKILMPKVIEFYNANRKDIDVFYVNTVIKEKMGCIFLVKMPNSKAQNVGGSTKYGDPRWMLQGTMFKYKGENKFFGAWLTKVQWSIIKENYGNAYDKIVFLYGNLLVQYHKIGDEENGKKVILKLDKFLKRLELESIDNIKESEIVKYFRTNCMKVIL